MIPPILYFCVYCYHLLVPGYLIARLLGLRRGCFLFALALSYALLVLNLIPMEWLRTPLWVFYLAFNLQVAVLLVANVIAGYRRRGRLWSKSGSRTPQHSEAATRQLFQRLLARWWPPLVIVLGVLIYLAWAGPYMELPADPWDHIRRFRHAWESIIDFDAGRFMDSVERVIVSGANWTLPDYFIHQGGHWYILHALFCNLSGLAIADSVLPLTLANTIVFCLAIYWFAMFLWSRQRISRSRKIQASLWTVCFTVLWLGVSVFAYIRYYAFAPTILNYVIYLAVVILMLDYFRSRYWWSHALWLVPVLLMTMNVIHTQEAVFAFFMGLGMIFVMEGQWIWTKIRYSEVRSQKSPRLPVAGPREPRGEQVHHAQGVVAPCGFAATGEVRSLPVMNMLKIHVFFVGGLCLFGLLLYYSLHKPIGGYSEFVLRPLFHSEWLGQKWFIQPLAGQFVQVVTWWGVFVYVLFLLYARNFRGQPFIWAGMLMPCLTVFNPLTLAILSRWIPDLNAIYRFNYMIPLPFVAGFLAMRFSNEIKLWIGAGWRNGMRSSQRDLPAKHAKGRENIIGAKDIEIITTKAPLCDGIIVGKPTSLRDLLFQKMSFFSVLSRISRDIIVHIKSMLFLRKIWAVLALLGLVVLLMPFEPLFGMKSNSRFYTLKPVPEGNDHRRWGDLIAFVRTHPQGQVLTDGYTSILLHEMGLTATDGDWWIRPSAPGADRLGLLRNLDRRNDWWLVVNRRNGDFSMNGYQSGHWPADVLMRFTSFYPEDLILFIKQHPELFKEIWSNDQIQVYDIVESRLWE